MRWLEAKPFKILWNLKYGVLFEYKIIKRNYKTQSTRLTYIQIVS